MSLRGNRDFRLWWTGSIISELGNGISGIAYPLLVLGATGSAAKAAMVGACYTVALAVLSLPAGVLADRYQRRRILVLSPLVDMVAVATIVPAVLTGHVWLTQLCAVAFVQGSMTALRSAAARPALNRIVAAEDIDQALSIELTRSGLVGLAAPPIGGLLFSIARWLPFGVDALSFGASMLTALSLRTPLGPEGAAPTDCPGADCQHSPEAEGRRLPFRTDLVEGLRYVWRSGYLRFMAGWSCLIGMALSALPLVTVVLLRSRGAGPVLIGVAYAIGAAGGLLGAQVAPKLIRRLPGRRLVLLGTWALVGSTVAVAVLPHPVQIALAIAAAYFLISPLIVVINAYETRTVPDALQGRVTMIMMMSELSLLWASLLVVGAIADRFGPAVAVLAIAGIFTIVAVISHGPALRQIDAPVGVEGDRDRTPDPRPAP